VARHLRRRAAGAWGGPIGSRILLPLTGFSDGPDSAIVMLSLHLLGERFSAARSLRFFFNIPGEACRWHLPFDRLSECAAAGQRRRRRFNGPFTSSFIARSCGAAVTFLAPGIASLRIEGSVRRNSRSLSPQPSCPFRRALARGETQDPSSPWRWGFTASRASAWITVLRAACALIFGSAILLRGINFLVAVIGLFGISEILLTMGSGSRCAAPAASISLRTVLKVWKEMPRYWVTLLRSSAIGCWLWHHSGGPIAASFMSYNLASASPRTRESFGKGRIEGVFAPETAAACLRHFTRVLLDARARVPGSGTAAILLGGLMVWGLNPGPLLFVEHKGFVWGLIARCISATWSASSSCSPRCRCSRRPRVPFSAIAPMIVVSCAIGAYAIQNAMFDIWLMLLFGVVGYVFQEDRHPARHRSRSRWCSAAAPRIFSPVDDRRGAGTCAVWSKSLVGSITRSPRAALLAADRRRVRPNLRRRFRRENRHREKIMSGEILLAREGDIATVTLSNPDSSTRSARS